MGNFVFLSGVIVFLSVFLSVIVFLSVLLC